MRLAALDITRPDGVTGSQGSRPKAWPRGPQMAARTVTSAEPAEADGNRLIS